MTMCERGNGKVAAACPESKPRNGSHEALQERSIRRGGLAVCATWAAGGTGILDRGNRGPRLAESISSSQASGMKKRLPFAHTATVSHISLCQTGGTEVHEWCHSILGGRRAAGEEFRRRGGGVGTGKEWTGLRAFASSQLGPEGWREPAEGGKCGNQPLNKELGKGAGHLRPPSPPADWCGRCPFDVLMCCRASAAEGGEANTCRARRGGCREGPPVVPTGQTDRLDARPGFLGLPSTSTPPTRCDSARYCTPPGPSAARMTSIAYGPQSPSVVTRRGGCPVIRVTCPTVLGGTRAGGWRQWQSGAAWPALSRRDERHPRGSVRAEVN